MSELGRDSLLVRIAGDWRSLLPGPSAGVMQLLHPGIGAGVVDHSEFFSDPMGRVYRSIPQIWATLLAPDGDERGRRLRDVHHAINGSDHRGERYHALDPEVFWWAHATFTWEMFRAVELFFARQLTPGQVDQLYADTVAWYARYGMSMRPVPASYQAFQAKFDHVCRHELDLTPAGERIIELAHDGAIDLPLLPPAMGRVVRRLAGPGGRAVLISTLPDVVRERFDIRLSRADRARFRVLRTLLRTSLGAVPPAVNRRTLVWALRWYGSKSRAERYVPPPRGVRDRVAVEQRHRQESSA